MTPTHKKLLREYGDPGNSMAAKEFRRDLARLVREVMEESAKVAHAEAKVARLEKVAEEYRFALIFYAAQANYIVAGEGMNWVIADQGARARAALDAEKEMK